LSVGKTVELIERNRVIARIIPEKEEEAVVTGSSQNRNPSWQGQKGGRLPEYVESDPGWQPADFDGPFL